MNISLTVIIDEESLQHDLQVGNCHTSLLEVDNLRLLVNCSGTVTAFKHNIEKLNVSLDRVDFVAITSPLQRYWASIRLLADIYKDVTILVPDCILTERYLAKALTRLNLKFQRVSSCMELCNNITIRKISSGRCSLYSELAIQIGNILLILVPGIVVSSVFDQLRSMLQNFKNIVIGFAISSLSPDLTECIHMIASLCRRGINVHLCHLTPRDVKRILVNKTCARVLRAGARVTFSC